MGITCAKCLGKGWLTDLQLCDIRNPYPMPWNNTCPYCQGTGLSEEGAHLVATVERLAAMHGGTE